MWNIKVVIRETIGRALQEFDTGIAVPAHQMPQQLYMDLSREGLNHSTITEWQEALSQEERDRIDQVIAVYIDQYKNENCQE